MRRIPVLAGLIAAAALAGCHSGHAHRPPTLRFGEEACDSCRMIISDERFAAALVTPAGDALKFDDVGCLIEHEAGHLRPDVTYWVRDSSTGQWLSARTAMFVHSPRVVSPMGFGLAARPAGQTEGEPTAGPDARTLRFDELPGLLADRSQHPEPDRPKAQADGL
jgi:nitrous oxide reductase accessory protein NosL